MTKREKRQMALRMGTVAGIISTAVGGFLAYRRFRRLRRPAGVSAFDADFTRTALALIADGIELGRVVGVRASDPHVRELAQRVVEHHFDSLSDLEDIAAYLGLNVSSEPSRQARRLARRLQKLQGPEIDRLFLAAVIDDNEEAVSIAEQALDLIEKPELKAFAGELRERMATHLDSARQRAEQLQPVTSNR